MVYIAQTGTDVEPKAISQDASVAATGAWTNTGINGTPVPHSQALVGTDSSGVIVPGTISQASITSALGYTPAPIASLPDTANLTFDYRFSDTTGATLTDYSGFNRNAAITNGSGLTRSGISYLMTSPAQVDLPTTVNGTNSYYFLSNLPVAQTGVSWGFNSNDGFLVNPSGGWGTQGVTIYTGGNIGTITISASPGVYGLEALGASAIVNSQVSDIIGAVHVIGLVCGTSSTTFYLDGYPLTNFRSTGNCNGANTVGNLRFQPQTTGVGYYYYRALGFSDVHSAATVLQVSTAIRAQGLAVGVPFTPVPYQSPKTFYFAAGDSITCGFGLSGCTGGGTSTLSYPALVPALLTNTYTSQNYGIPAALVQQQIITAPATYQPLCNTASGQTIASLMEGTNNFQGTSVATAASVFQLNVAWGRLMKTAGCRYTFIAMISRTGNANNGAITYDAAKNNLNAVFRSGWAQSGANGFVDVGADPHLGCDGCYSNSTYFQGDGIHPTAAGQTILANADACIINGMDGSSPQLPNPTPITASTYTATCSDGGLIADTSSNNITITLNSALWQTGRVVQVCNNSASGSNALTVAAPSDFPFDNILGRTTATIANHSCQQWQAMFNGNTTTPGDFWQTGVQ
jgi:lysophospholipase L1-like esterase